MEQNGNLRESDAVDLAAIEAAGQAAGEAPRRRALGVLVVFGASLMLLASVWVTRTRPPLPTPFAAAAAHAGVDYQKPFQWSDDVPVLYNAAALPPGEAMRFLLQNDRQLRTYVAMELKTPLLEDSAAAAKFANAPLGDPALEAAITRQIDQVVHERTQNQATMISVDYPLELQPFPFNMIVALKSQTRPSASLVYFLTGHNGITAATLLSQYGPPQQTTTDSRSYPLMIYQTTTENCTAKTEFQLDPDSKEVRRVSVTVQRNAP